MFAALDWPLHQHIVFITTNNVQIIKSFSAVTFVCSRLFVRFLFDVLRYLIERPRALRFAKSRRGTPKIIARSLAAIPLRKLISINLTIPCL
jgi:hypothetical protein